MLDKKLSEMTPEEEQRFFDEFERALKHDTGEAAQDHLNAGYPIYYEDPQYPDYNVKEYPDGRRELVTVDDTTGEIILVRAL